MACSKDLSYLRDCASRLDKLRNIYNCERSNRTIASIKDAQLATDNCKAYNILAESQKKTSDNSNSKSTERMYPER